MPQDSFKEILSKMQENMKRNPAFKSEISSDNKFPADAETVIVGDNKTYLSKYFGTNGNFNKIDKLFYLNKKNRKNFNIRYHKFLDVKSPKISDGLSIGVDLYLPKIDKKFFEAFYKVNETNEIKFQLVEDKNYIFIKEESRGKDWLIYDKERENLVICHNCTIPSGIGIDIPSGYFMDVRPRSSCHKSNYTLILGTIDEDYTYGFGFQIFLYDNYVSFEKDIRIAQCLLIKGELIDSMEEMTEEAWNNDEVIMRKRETRTGGFGSTGKK